MLDMVIYSWPYCILTASKFHVYVPFPEKSIQELCQGPSSVEKNGHFFCTSTQDYWYSWGGMWNCSDPCARETKRRGQLYSATGHASGALLPSAGWRSSKTLCSRPGFWYFADVSAAHRSSGWGSAWEGGETRRADQCPGKEQSQSFLAPQFHKERRAADLCFSDSREGKKDSSPKRWFMSHSYISAACKSALMLPLPHVSPVKRLIWIFTLDNHHCGNCFGCGFAAKG